MKTRKFEFPNAGHSVRKLSQELRDLGEALVIRKCAISEYDDNAFDVWYEVSTRGVSATKLANMLVAKGTRFVCDSFMESKYGNSCSMTLYTNVSDLEEYPEVYGN